MAMGFMPDAEVKLQGNRILITIRNEQIVNGLVAKLQGELGKVVDVKYDSDSFILTVDFSDIEKKYNYEFSNRFGVNDKFLEIENKTATVKIKRNAIRLMLEKLFKGMTVLDYGDRFEISGEIDLGSIPSNIMQGLGGGFPPMNK